MNLTRFDETGSTDPSLDPALLNYEARMKESFARGINKLEETKTTEDESPVFDRMPTATDLAKSAYNAPLDLMISEYKRTKEMPLDEMAIETALNSLQIGGINRFGVKTGGRWFHGTPKGQSVIKEGFDLSKSGSQNSTSMGEGIYFSNYPETANRYSRDQYPKSETVFPVKYKESGIRPLDTPIEKKHEKILNDLIEKADESLLQNFNEDINKAKIEAFNVYKKEPLLVDAVNGILKDLYGKYNYEKAINILNNHNLSGFEKTFKDGEKYRVILDTSILKPGFGKNLDKNRKQ